MAMSESERLRRIQEQATSYVNRAKCVDSSLLTFMNQMKASKGTVAPQTVTGKIVRDGCCATVSYKGKGTNMDQSALIAAAAGCAICSDEVSPSGGIKIPTVCVDNFAPPFTQQNLSTMYVTPCKVPGPEVYFPTVPVRGENCNLPHLPYDSH